MERDLRSIWMNDRVEELSKEGDCFNGMTARRNMFKLKESTTAPGQSYSTAEAGMTQAGTHRLVR